MIAAQQKQAAQKTDEKPSIPGLAPEAASKSTKKKKKKPAGQETAAVQETTKKLAAFTIEEPTFGAPAIKEKCQKGTSVPAPSTEANGVDPAKKIKNLRKKLRDTEALEQKIKSGEVKNPDKDQLDKIKRKKEVVKEIQELEKLTQRIN